MNINKDKLDLETLFYDILLYDCKISNKRNFGKKPINDLVL